jgi:hypothetical protein
MYCGAPMGDVMFDVMQRTTFSHSTGNFRQSLRTEFCDKCLDKHWDEIVAGCVDKDLLAELEGVLWESQRRVATFLLKE